MATSTLHPPSGTMTLSLREKSQMRERINREHNSNFRAGYVHIHPDQLLKTGIRGRKAYCLYCVVIVLFLAALANLAANIALLYVLNWQWTGPAGLELAGDLGLTRFLQDAVLEDVTADQFNSYQDQGIEIKAHKGQKIFASVENKKSKKPGGSYVYLDENQLVMSSPGGVFFQAPGSNKASSWITPSSAKVRFPNLNYLNTEKLIANKVQSLNKSGLLITANSNIYLQGGTGVKIRGKNVVFEAEKDINLISKKSVKLSAKKGIIFPPVKNMPKADPGSTELGLVLCVCLPDSKLYAVKSGSRCDQVVPEDNPCKP